MRRSITYLLSAIALAVPFAGPARAAAAMPVRSPSAVRGGVQQSALASAAPDHVPRAPPSVGRWELLGGALNARPAAASWALGRLDVFVNGTDGQLWHQWYDGRWSAWEPLGGGLVGAPTVTSWAPGRLDVFVNGTDGQLWHKWYDGRWSGGSRWAVGSSARQRSRAGRLVGSTCSSTAPTASSGTSGTTGGGRVGAAGRWARRRANGHELGPWSARRVRQRHRRPALAQVVRRAVVGWEPLGGVIVGDPLVTSWGTGRLDVFVIGTDGLLWHRYYDSGWPGWEGLGVRLDPRTAVVSWGPNRADIFTRGTTGELWHTWYDGGWA